MSKTKKSQNSKMKIISIVISCLAGIAIIGQIFFNMYIYRVVTSHESHSIVDVLAAAIEGLSSPAVVDGPTGKVYIPENRLVLPPYSESQVNGLLYSRYTDETEVTITTSAIYSQAKARMVNISVEGASSRYSTDKVFEDIFTELPNVQTCSRVIHIAFKKLDDTSGLAKIASKKLADGRKVVFYKEMNCSLDTTELVKYLKSVESY